VAALKIEAIRSSETSVYTIPPGRHIPEEGILEIFFFIFFLILKKKETCRAMKQIEKGREKVGLARFSHSTTQHKQLS
jgi:hypothetical protein